MSDDVTITVSRRALRAAYLEAEVAADDEPGEGGPLTEFIRSMPDDLFDDDASLDSQEQGDGDDADADVDALDAAEDARLDAMVRERYPYLDRAFPAVQLPVDHDQGDDSPEGAGHSVEADRG